MDTQVVSATGGAATFFHDVALVPPNTDLYAQSTTDFLDATRDCKEHVYILDSPRMI